MQAKRKRVLITGSTGTIGSAVAERFAAPGMWLALAYGSDDAGAQALAERVGAVCQVQTIGQDLSERDGPEKLIARSHELMGGLDALIHCAAVFERAPLGTVTEEQWDRVVDTNLKASFFLAQAACARMREAGGSILMLSDVAAQKPYSGYLPYCISKAGVDAMVKGLAKTAAPKVSVNAIAPYLVSRPDGMSDEGWKDMLDKTPIRRASSPEEIAELAYTIVQSCDTITGQVIAVDGGRMLR